jgi:hypothetical protein
MEDLELVIREGSQILDTIPEGDERRDTDDDMRATTDFGLNRSES